MDYFNHSNRHMYRVDKNIFFIYTFRTRNAPVGTMFIHSEQQKKMRI